MQYTKYSGENSPCLTEQSLGPTASPAVNTGSYYSVLDEIRKQLDYEVDSSWMKFNVYGVYIAACVGMTLIPYKGIPLIVFGSLSTMLSEYGYEINYE